jgi:hypothetical protein
MSENKPTPAAPEQTTLTPATPTNVLNLTAPTNSPAAAPTNANAK